MDTFDQKLDKDEIKLMHIMDECAFNQNERFSKIIESTRSILAPTLEETKETTKATKEPVRKQISLDLGKKKTQALSPDPLKNSEPKKQINLSKNTNTLKK